jgi:SNF2 family DNA or RNA helicase
MFIYEEFMARSSTRQALMQGANFMGMMNVLMQLRKVCNHPDLFEPRSVVTPLVVDQIVYPMASCVIGLTSCVSAFAKISSSLLYPLWCGSEGEVSMSAACSHDRIQSIELLELEATMDYQSNRNEWDDEYGIEKVCPVLQALVNEINHAEDQLRRENVGFINRLNTRRCHAAQFAYPERLIDIILLPELPIDRDSVDVLLYPSQLLAMRRDLCQRADDVDWLVKRFVFAVPKADARPIALDANIARDDNCKTTPIHGVLFNSMQESLRPFREAHARLTTFFPDKKLVQFDAGKLQALAELLRERKQGGHKVLIFTQMSKMLDILEAFLNMNGHTYVRLDGGTSIDQRQRLMDRFNNDPKIFCFILSTRSGGTGVNLTGADTVIFYDSDWNPAQDAQAQDRAHR